MKNISVLLCISVVACAETPIDLSEASFDIRGGAVASPGEWEAVGSLRVAFPAGGGGECTATLINDESVLTAGHCVCVDDVALGNCAATGVFTLRDVFTPTSPATRVNVQIVGTILPHPDYDINGVSLANDYALVRLNQRASSVAYVTPIQVQRLLPKVGDPLTLLGFGRTGPSCNLPPNGKNVAITAIDAINLHGTSGNKRLEYADAVVGICLGDSGGPSIDGAGKILGVHSATLPGGTNADASTATAWPWLQQNACGQSFDQNYIDGGFCDELCPCVSSEGDCDSSLECTVGNSCVQDIGVAALQSSTDDLCWPNTNLTTFYTNTNFGGTSYALPAGIWNLATLVPNIGNDTISSLIAPDGFLATLYSEADCRITSAVFTGANASLGGMDNHTSCLMITPTATLFAGTNYSGAKATLATGGNNHVMLGAVGNDNAESIKLAPGVFARVCSESGAPGGIGWGTCQDIGGSVSLGALANSVSNVEVFPGVTVYADIDYVSTKQTFKVGTYTNVNFSTIINDTISSLVAAPGIVVTMCSEANGTGNCRTYRGSNSSMGKGSAGVSMNDTVSYIKVEQNLAYGPRTESFAGSSLELPGYWSLAAVRDFNPNSVTGAYGYSSTPVNLSTQAQSLTIKMSTSKTFSKVVLHPRNDAGYVGVGFPLDFRIQVWNGTTWIDRLSRTNYAQPLTPQSFTWGFSDTTDQIRILVTTMRPVPVGGVIVKYAMQLSEVEIF